MKQSHLIKCHCERSVAIPPFFCYYKEQSDAAVSPFEIVFTGIVEDSLFFAGIDCVIS